MHLSIQDFITILGPILTLMGFMWHHFNKSMGELKADIKTDIKDVRFDIKRVEEKLGADIKRVEEKLGADIKRVEEKLGADIKRVEEKVDAVRDRVSRIEGQLVPAKVISFEETRPKQTARPTHSKVAQAH
jgi:phage host-nuclease inhibitor protein Gam